MKKKMSDRDLSLVLVFLAIVIVAVVYVFVFKKFNERKAELLAQNEQLQAEVAQLADMAARAPEVEAETEVYLNEIRDTLSKFPSEVKTQDVIYDLNEMYESISDVKIQSESYSMNQLFYQPAAGVDANGNPIVADAVPNASVSAITSETSVEDVVSASVNYTGYRSDITVVYTAPYNSVKEIVNFINNSKDRMTITNISMTELSETEDLSCNMVVSMYAISGTGEIYKEPEIAGFGKIGSVFGN